MSDSAVPSAQPLQAIFAGEARLHLAQLDSGLAALAGSGAPAALAEMLEALHTLGGAARAVELRELEWLCGALERVFGAPGAGGRLGRDQLDLLADAVALAHQLLGDGAGHGKRALTLVGQLDALARELTDSTCCTGHCAQPTATP